MVGVGGVRVTVAAVALAVAVGVGACGPTGAAVSAPPAPSAAGTPATVEAGPTLGPPVGPTTGSSAAASAAGPSTASPATASPTRDTAPTPAAPSGSRPAPASDPSATPAPAWLGTRPLGPAGGGPVAPQQTPPELLDRRIVTVDVLPPPPDDAFTARVSAVPADVLDRSTWQAACPVAADDLRHVTVAFWGFDGRPHTGELLVHADAADAVVAAFRAMHAERFPLEEVRVITPADLAAAPTGDGNVTSVFVCRPAVGSTRWSAHAYGRALDVNPFHNPYERGSGDDRVVIPELATAYTDRDRRLPGMLDDGSAAVRALREAGWTWGGDYASVRDWMHLSADGT